jgi:hypothetical protein
MANDLKFGDVVIIPHQLRRKSEHRIRESGGSDWWKVWEVKPFPKNRTGILIGFRTISTGTIWYGGEDGTVYDPKSYLKAALVALDARTKPVLVLLDDVKNEIEMPQA